MDTKNQEYEKPEHEKPDYEYGYVPEKRRRQRQIQHRYAAGSTWFCISVGVDHGGSGFYWESCLETGRLQFDAGKIFSSFWQA